MPPTTCDRCGNEYDTERETPNPHMNSARCPKCGCENEPDGTPAPAPAAARADGGVPDVARVVEQIETDGKELHLHVHYHSE